MGKAHPTVERLPIKYHLTRHFFDLTAAIAACTGAIILPSACALDSILPHFGIFPLLKSQGFAQVQTLVVQTAT